LPATCSSQITRLTLLELHCAFLRNDSDWLMIVNAQPRWRDLHRNQLFPNFEENFGLELSCESLNVQFGI
jgi:hypothetical protein